MRQLTPNERFVVRWFAKQVNEPERRGLLNDLENATAEDINDEQLTVRFTIEGYVPPSYQTQRPLQIGAVVLDEDGAKLSVDLLTDQNGRLFGLDVLRFENGPVLAPDWTTLRIPEPGEVIKLNESNRDR